MQRRLPIDAVTRGLDEEGAVKLDYHLSNAPADIPRAEFARVTNAEHRVEDCIKRSKSEAGMADYQVRNWLAWVCQTTPDRSSGVCAVRRRWMIFCTALYCW
jgi:hypothetical protein